MARFCDLVSWRGIPLIDEDIYSGDLGFFSQEFVCATPSSVTRFDLELSVINPHSSFATVC